MFIWNPHEHTNQENQQWSVLRAMEWEALPAFISQPIVPVLLIFFQWYFIIGAVLVASWLWAIVRHSFVSIVLSEIAYGFVKLRWLTVPCTSIYLFFNGSYFLGIVVLLWVALAAAIGFTVPGGKSSVIQRMFLASMGYELDDAW
jgi:hypothetical protein